MPGKALEQTHYPSLGEGHPVTSCTDISIVGLEIKVYGLEEIKHSSLPIAAVIAGHGRTNQQKQMATFSYCLLGHEKAIARGKARKRDMIVVTLDLPNHGERTKNKKNNLSYDKNPKHFYDLAALIVGGCRDFQQIIDFLAAYLFPHGDRVIEEYIPTGVSLGGHITWRLLRLDPRINIGMPIIGLPFEAYTRYLGARAVNMGFSFSPPIYPPSLKPLLEAPVSDDAYYGKKILTMHGEKDELVPYHQGKVDIDEVVRRSKKGEVEVWIQDGAGHVVTVKMIQRAAEWVWRWALCADKMPASL